jgi:hypothetical protein
LVVNVLGLMSTAQEFTGAIATDANRLLKAHK